MDGRTEWEYGVRETAQHLELRQAVSATVLLGNLGDGLHFCGLQSSLSVKARVESENWRSHPVKKKRKNPVSIATLLC